jgi:hypothetical protein
MEKIKSSILYIYITCLVLITTTGCLSGNKPDRHLTSGYEAVGEVKAKAPVALTLVTMETKTEYDSHLVGRLDNLDGVRVADVFLDDATPGSWVTDALAAELTRAGCQVSRAATLQEAGDAIVISGSVEKFFVETDSAYKSEILATFTVTTDGKTRLKKDFSADFAQFSFSGSAGGCKGALQSALQLVMKKATPELLKAME